VCPAGSCYKTAVARALEIRRPQPGPWASGHSPVAMTEELAERGSALVRLGPGRRTDEQERAANRRRALRAAEKADGVARRRNETDARWMLMGAPCDRCAQPVGYGAWLVPHLGRFCSKTCVLVANAGIVPYLLPEDESRWAEA
jgi:hypothetical protein